jgi:hypothetical protein
MKLNNKGFAISTVMYLILVAAVILITLTLSLLSSRKLILDKIRNESKENIYNVYDITYRQALETLKQEYLDYLNTNNITTTKSIKIGDLETSIDSNIINGYNLNDKYLTNIGSSIYLGKSKTITDISTTQDKFIDIYDAKIYGNSEQDIYTGKNLFDINALKSRTNIVDSNNNIVVPNGPWTYNTRIKLSEITPKLIAGETYIISLDSTHSEVSLHSIYLSNGTRWTNGNSLQMTEALLNSNVYFYVVQGESGNTIISNLQIEKGSTATSYEPYVGGTPSPNPEYPQEIRSVGELVTDTNDSNYGKYKIPIKISSKNLIDTSKLSYGIIKSDGSTEEVNWYMYTDYIEVSGDYLTYSKTGKTSSSLRNFNFYDKDKVFISGGIQKTDEEGSDYYTIDIPEGAKYFRLNVAPSYVDKAMVELGNNYTGYEPSVNTINIYLNEPLRKIGDYVDSTDLASNKVVRNIYEYIFTGNERWSGGSTSTSGWGGTNTVGFYQYFTGINGNLIFNPSYLPINKSSSLNNYFKNGFGAYAINTQLAGFTDTYYNIRITRSILENYGSSNASDAENQNAFKAWLKDKYDSGNPVKVYYQLADPAEDTLSANHTSYGEYTNISVDTSMQPTNMEFTVIEKIKEI